MNDPTATVREVARDRTFLLRYPYYAAVLARIDAVVDPTVSSMGVSLHGRRFYLHVNPDYFVASPQHLRGILLHEVHHIVLGHLTNPRLMDAAHEDLMELAKEVSANEHIEEPLPDPITWRAFERQGLRPMQSTRERYQRLVAAREAARPQAFRPVPRFVDDHGPGRRGRGEPVTGVDPARALVEEALADAGPEQELDGGDPRRGLLAGRTPGRLIEELAGTLGPPEVPVDWRTALAMFVAARRAPAHRWGLPNRRFPSRIGEVPGRMFVDRAIERPRILVAIDTSGSMGEAELAEVARQLRVVAEHVDLVVAEIDTEIACVGPFAGQLPRVHGRGGTDLRPAFDGAFLAAQRCAAWSTSPTARGRSPSSRQPCLHCGC